MITGSLTPPTNLHAVASAENSQGANIPLWADTLPHSPRAKLEQNLKVDVCVVGAGIAGLTTAYLLAREGVSVAVLEKNIVGAGETSRTTAHLSNEIDARYTEIERLHGTKGAKVAAQSHTIAIEQIASIIAQENIDCDFIRLDGYLVLAHGHPVDSLHEEFHAAQRAGVEVEQLDHAPFGLNFSSSLRFPQQGQFHPLKYLEGLLKALERCNGKLFENTEVTEIEDGDRPIVKTASGPVVSAKHVVVATNTPVNDRLAMHTKQAAYRTYAIGAVIPDGSVPPALIWDVMEWIFRVPN